MNLKELKGKGYKTITSLRKIDNSIRPEKIPESLKIGGIKFGSGIYYPENTIKNILDYFFNTPSYEKMKQTNLIKYGVENVFSSEEIKNKIKQTNLIKYGSEYAVSSNIIRDKIKQTNLNKYGVENPLQLKEIQEKAKQTNLKNHNGLYNSQTSEYLKKRSETWLKRYGVDNIAKIGLNQSKKIEYDGLYFDSKWEVYYYFYLKDNNIDFEYHPNVILEYEFENKKCRYLPDFRVLDRLVEIKGDHFFDKNGNLINPFKDDNGKSFKKQKCMEENNVLILKGIDIIPFKKYYLAKQPLVSIS